MKHLADCPVFAGICGKAKESHKSTADNSAPEARPYEEDDDVRIVNGWDAPARPFMVLIRLIDPTEADSYETCGGAILNRFAEKSQSARARLVPIVLMVSNKIVNLSSETVSNCSNGLK